MTARTRFLNTPLYAPADRPPLWDEGIRDDVLLAWAKQGLDPGVDPRDLFIFDRHEDLAVDLAPRPTFDERSDDPEVFVRLRDHYRAEPARLPDDLHQRIREWAQRDYPLGLTVWRGLLQTLAVHDWRSLQRVLLALHDFPSVLGRTLHVATDCALKTVEQVFGGVMLDYAVFEEPIASAHGSVISPSYFRRFCSQSYLRLVDLLQARGVQWFIVRCYGDPTELIPEWLDVGINVLWCCERAGAAMDYRRLRRQYGRDLRLIGGIDVDAIRGGPDRLSDTLERDVAWLVEDGGYIPMADGRIRRPVTWRQYANYRRQLERLVKARLPQESPS